MQWSGLSWKRPRDLRILIIHSRFREPLGGAELYALQLANSLSERGHTVAVASASGFDIARERLHRTQVERLSVKSFYDPGVSASHSATAKALWHGLDIFNPTC